LVLGKIKMKILITGGAGFIGYHLASKLSENLNNNIVIADNLQRGRKDKYFSELISKENVKFISVDLTNYSEVKAKIGGHFDCIYHLAAIVGVKHCMNNPDKVLDINLKSTQNVVALAKENKCGRLLFSSTCETYASGFELGIVNVPTAESVPLVIKNVKNPRMSYAGSKIVGEQLVVFNSSEFGGDFDYSIVRYHNVYGPRMGYAHMLPEVVKRSLSGENPFKVFGHDQTRAFCYVSDAVEQTILAMNHIDTKNEILHIGNSLGETKIVDGIKEIHSEIGYNGELEMVDAPFGSVNKRCPDTSKIHKLTGFVPKINVSEGFRKTTAWYINDLKENGAWE
jgi:UDP-glucose 4-epimerase